MGFSRQKYWSGLPLYPLGDLPDPGIKPLCLALQHWQANSLPLGEGNGTPLQYSPGKSHGWRSLVGCSPWGREESDMTERLHFHCSLSCIGEGNGNPLQCSCLENPRDGGAWWAAVYGAAQSWTRLKRLSSSSSTWEVTIPVLKSFVFSSTISTVFRAVSVTYNQEIYCIL